MTSGFCQTAPTQTETLEAAKVRSVVEGIIAADNARDLARVLSYYAEDAILLPLNDSPVVGKEKIKPRYEALFANYQPEIKVAIEEVTVTQDWAFVRGYNTGRLLPLKAGEPRVLSDVFLMILRRTDDERWEIARLMWHLAPTLKAEMKQ